MITARSAPCVGQCPTVVFVPILATMVTLAAGCEAPVVPGDETPDHAAAEPPAAAAAAAAAVERSEASPLDRAIVAAAEGERVPPSILRVVAWAESQFRSQTGRGAPGAHEGEAAHDALPDESASGHGCGYFGLDAAVRLRLADGAGIPPERLCSDVQVEARVAARWLRQLAPADLGGDEGDLAAWLPILDGYHVAGPSPYQGYARALLGRGLGALDDSGQRIQIAARRGLAGISTATPLDVAAQRAYLTPDTPLAEWQGEACYFTPASRGIGDIEYVVIHTCEGPFMPCANYLKSCNDPQVSAHYVTSYAGFTVQLLEEKNIAHHVGCLNTSSIGIEHEGAAGDATHPDAQYCQTASLVRSICDRWEIPCDRAHVIGHVEANEMFCHGSHWDPGPNWDWDTFMDYVQNGCSCESGAEELCNGRDDDCDGDIDEGDVCPVCAPIPAGGAIIDESGPCFTRGGTSTYWNEDAAGWDDSVLWTHTTDSADVDNRGLWAFELAAAGDYLVCAHTPSEFAQSRRAPYDVATASGTETVAVDQTQVDGWTEIGRFAFATGPGSSVELRDNSGEPYADRVRIAFDALKILPASSADCSVAPTVTTPVTPEEGDAGTDGMVRLPPPGQGCACAAAIGAGSSTAAHHGLLALLAAMGLALRFRSRPAYAKRLADRPS